ncbi:2-oxoglutarate dehydrogenase E1 subunit family protein, partial [Streptomyces anthocyanicus]
MSPQSPSNSSISTDTDQAGTAGKNPAAAFGANEWLVDEIYQQYLQDPNSVDRAWWDFFADYKPGAAATPTAAGTVPTDAGSTPPAAPAPRAQAPAQPQAAAPAPAPAKP